MSFTYNAKLVAGWGEDRNLIKGSTPHAQLLKLGGELGELASAILRDDREAIVDELGDNLVVLVIMAAQLNIDLSEALRLAYLKIKDRKGAMIDGVFVKEADLPENWQALAAASADTGAEPTQKQLDMVAHLARFGQFLEDCSKGRMSVFHQIFNSGV